MHNNVMYNNVMYKWKKAIEISIESMLKFKNPYFEPMKMLHIFIKINKVSNTSF